MKTILVSTLAAAGLALSISSAFAVSNSPQGAVIIGGEAPAVTGYGQAYGSSEAAPHARFLSGEAGPDQTFGLSSNAVEGREFHAVQQGGHWFRQGGE